MKSKNLVRIFAGIILLTGAATATSTIAWFTQNAKIRTEDNDVTGSTEGAYFAYGDGTSGNKYGITKPRHLYNLAWLHYLGYFNNKPQMYFELADNIDMTGWALPPIGTEFHPFVGNFDGQGYVVSNLLTTNDYTDFGIRHPSEVTQTMFNQDDGSRDRHPNVIGFFGVIGNLDSKYGGTYSSSVNEVKNFALKNTTVKTDTLPNNTASLIGTVAGYVDATTKDIAVDSSKISIGSGTTEFNSSLTSKLSDYGLVGYTTTKKIFSKMKENIYALDVTNVPEFSAADQGTTAGFGGSVDMYKLYQRILSAKTNTRNGTNGWTNSTSGQYTYRSNVTSTADHIESETSTNKTGNNEVLTYVSGNEFGTYSQFNRTSSPANQWLYLLGGYNKVTSFSEYFATAKITDGNNNYMTTNNPNNGSVTNVKNQGSALTWTIPSKSAAEIYIESNNTKYYLTISGNDVVLQTNASQRTLWTREDSGDGKIRFSNGDRYLFFNGSKWTVGDMPTKPTAPGNEPLKPNTDYGDCLEGSKQISYENGEYPYYVKETFSNNAFSATTSFAQGWFFSDSSLPNNGTTKIYTKINNTNYYVWVEVEAQQGSGCEGGNTTYTYTLKFDTTSTGSATKLVDWTIAKNGNLYSFSVKHADDTGKRYYLRHNDSSVTIGTSTSNNLFSIVDPFEEYTQYLEDYAEWKSLSETYDTDYSNYLAALASTFPVKAIGEQNISETYIDNQNDSRDKMVYNHTNTNYIPLNVVQDGEFTTMANYMPKDNNTGYIISGSKLSGGAEWNGTSVSDTRVAYHATSTYIGNSFSSNTIHDVYTVDFDGNHLIEENPNDNNYSVANSKYVKYASSFYKLQETMKNSGSNVYGLHFMSSEITKNNVVNVPKVKISNEKNIESDNKIFSNYDLPVGSIDFNLSENGYVNFFGGAFYSSGTVDTFFSLHKVFRNSSNAITDIKEIQKVYSDGNLDHSYIIEFKGEPKTYTKPFIIHDDKRYNLSPTNSQSYTDDNLYVEGLMNTTDYIKYSQQYSYRPVFDTDWITNHSGNSTIRSLNQKYMYYFEIPVNYGEYCLGPVLNGNGGYLLYLDIGANASKIQRTTFIDHIEVNEDVMEHPIGMAIIDMPLVEYKPGAGPYVTDHNVETGQVITDRDIDVDADDSVCIAITVGYSGDFIIERTANDVAMTKAVSTASNGKLIYTGDEITSVTVNGEDAELECTKYSYEIYRLTYYDYNVSEEDVTVTTIADISRNGGESQRQAYQIVHYGTNEQSMITNPSQMAVFKDDGGLYKYSSGTYEFMNKNILPIVNDKTDILISFKTKQDTSSSSNYQDQPDYNLLVKLDDSLVDEYYYLLDGYQIVIKPKGSAIEVTILEVADGNAYRAIYFGTVNDANKIAYNDEGRTITIDVVP